MATWQFTTRIVPSGKTAKDEKPWLDVKISQAVFQKLNNVLSKEKSWSNSISQFGELESTCIEFIKEGDAVAEVSMRIDCRTLSKDLVKLLLEFVKEINGVLVLANGDTVQPNFDDVVVAIESSDAFAFVKDPAKFLTLIRKIAKKL